MNIQQVGDRVKGVAKDAARVTRIDKAAENYTKGYNTIITSASSEASSKDNRIAYVLGAMLFWAVIMFFWSWFQTRPLDFSALRSLAPLFGIFFLLAFSLGFVKAVRNPAISIGMYVPTIALVIWFYLVGFHNFGRDVLGILAGIFVGTIIFGVFYSTDLKESEKHKGPDKDSEQEGKAAQQEMAGRVGARLMVVMTCGFWVMISFFDLTCVSSEPVLTSPDRFIALETQYPDAKVGVALSGGGYRAALYHAGVLNALEKAAVPITHLSTVSGGSIIGAFYAQGGCPCDFLTAVTSKRFNLKRDLLTLPRPLQLLGPMKLPVMRPELNMLPWHYSRLNVQANLLDRILFNNMLNDDFIQSKQPKLLINTTDLNNGLMVGFSGSKAVVVGPAGAVVLDEWQSDFIKVDDTPRLASLVAVSGAFPGAFPPTEFYIPTKQETSNIALSLADGGVLDNSGVYMMLSAHELAKRSSTSWKWPSADDPSAESPAGQTQLFESMNLLSMAVPIDDSWGQIDVILASDGGQFFSADSYTSSLESVNRAIDLAGLYSDPPNKALEEKNEPLVIQLDPDDFRVDLSKESKKKCLARVREDGFLPEDIFQNSTFVSLLPRAILTNTEKEEIIRDLDFCKQQEQPLTAEDFERAKFEEQDLLLKALEEDICYAVDIFKEASTLEDQYGAQKGNALMRLGMYAVLMRRKNIEDSLESQTTTQPFVEGNQQETQPTNETND